ncbi:MAG: TIGR03618 family F420-dependent PPOX class oxidoreductase [Chloroflexota bacterium]
MSKAVDETIQTFLSDTRIGILTSLTSAGAPLAVPIWYEWDGERIWFFSEGHAAKIKRLQRDPRVSLLVARPAGEPEYWVAVDGTAKIHDTSALDLIERLAARYWDLSQEGPASILKSWRDNADSFRLVEIVPTKIRSYG